MPLAIEDGRIPVLLKRAKAFEPTPTATADETSSARNSLRIALVNNMPDGALEDTELQFFALLNRAASDARISLKLFSLPNIPRSDWGRRHLDDFYADINELFLSRFDALIITGTEPKRPDMREEPYWSALVDVLSWAENNTSSAVLSCLAAHAGVLARDDISRNPLGDKQFGVFKYEKTSAHPLTDGIGESMRMPHSRWNEVKTHDLTACGYQVLTQSTTAGADLFVKQTKKSLFVHFQGHPEYSTRTLLKEYRRDIKRFLRRERETYPSMPQGYFDESAAQTLADFQKKATAHPCEETLVDFPEAAVAATIQNCWSTSAVTVYRNWLQYLQLKRAEQRADIAIAPVVRT